MKKYKVAWTQTAINDIEDIVDYISIDSVEKAYEQYSRIKESTTKLYNFPDQGRIIPELDSQNIRKHRELVVTPWRIMYKREQKKVYIMVVIDGRRNIEDILLRRNIRGN